MVYIVYCCLFDQKYVYETIYSIRSIFDFEHQDKEIVIITDKMNIVIEELEKLPIEIQKKVIIDSLDEETQEEWKNRKPSKERIKILLIEYFLKKYQSNMLLFDSDTFMIHSIDPLIDMVKQKKSILQPISGLMMVNKKSIGNIQKLNCNPGYLSEKILKKKELSTSEIFRAINENQKENKIVFHYSFGRYFRYFLASHYSIFCENDQYEYQEILKKSPYLSEVYQYLSKNVWTESERNKNEK